MSYFVINSDLRKVPDENLIKLSEFFVIVLVGVSFEATIHPIGEAIRHGDRPLGNVLLLFTFITLTFRFLVGNFRHLRSEAWDTLPRFLLLYDMWWIGLESVTMIFLGTLTSVESNVAAHKSASADYICLQSTLFAFDAIWIASQGLLNRMFDQSSRWRRHAEDIPYPWLYLDLGLIVVLNLYKHFSADVLSDGFLWVIVGISSLAFIVDVIGIDTRKRASARGARREAQAATSGGG